MESLVQIEVTQNDIDEGVQKNANYCPVSRAGGRAMSAVMGRPMRMHVTTATCRVIDAASGLQVAEVWMPEAATDFIRRFDATSRWRCEPVSFPLVFDPAVARRFLRTRSSTWRSWS